MLDLDLPLIVPVLVVAALLTALYVRRRGHSTVSSRRLGGTVVGRSGRRVCPHLGSADDPSFRSSKPDDDHRCYLWDQRDRIDLAHQKGFCLSAAHPHCPWLAIARKAGGNGSRRRAVRSMAGRVVAFPVTSLLSGSRCIMGAMGRTGAGVLRAGSIFTDVAALFQVLQLVPNRSSRHGHAPVLPFNSLPGAPRVVGAPVCPSPSEVSRPTRSGEQRTRRRAGPTWPIRMLAALRHKGGQTLAIAFSAPRASATALGSLVRWLSRTARVYVATPVCIAARWVYAAPGWIAGRVVLCARIVLHFLWLGLRFCLGTALAVLAALHMAIVASFTVCVQALVISLNMARSMALSLRSLCFALLHLLYDTAMVIARLPRDCAGALFTTGQRFVSPAEHGRAGDRPAAEGAADPMPNSTEGGSVPLFASTGQWERTDATRAQSAGGPVWTQLPMNLDVWKVIEDGKVASRLGDREMAHVCFSLAADMDPDNVEVWLWRSAIAHKKQEKRQFYERALALGPRDPRGWDSAHSTAQARLDNTQAGTPEAPRVGQEAVDSFLQSERRGGIRMESEEIELLEPGLAALERGDEGEAHRVFVHATKAHLNSEKAWLWRAKTAVSLAELISGLEHVVAINPTNEKAKQDLVWATERLEREQRRRRYAQPFVQGRDAISNASGYYAAATSSPDRADVTAQVGARRGGHVHWLPVFSSLLLAMYWLWGAAALRVNLPAFWTLSPMQLSPPTFTLANVDWYREMELIPGYNLLGTVPYVVGVLSVFVARGLFRRQRWAALWGIALATATAVFAARFVGIQAWTTAGVAICVSLVAGVAVSWRELTS